MICDAEPANGDLRPWLGFRASRCVPDRRIKANHPSPPQPFLLTDVRPRTPRALAPVVAVFRSVRMSPFCAWSLRGSP